jgi:hypothetical protein
LAHFGIDLRVLATSPERSDIRSLRVAGKWRASLPDAR